MKSKKEGEAIARRVNEAKAKFDEWYQEQGYSLAADSAPHDSGEGGYLGTIDAEDLLPDFFEVNSKYVFYEEQLRQYCYEIGELFNSDKWNFTDEPSDEDLEEVRVTECVKFLGDLQRIHKVRQRFKKK